MDILLILGVPLILTVIISIGLNSYLEYSESHEKQPISKRKIHVMFPGHFALATIALLFSAHWFGTGEDWIDYGSFWNIVERGTIEALTSVMSIVGVGSILLGWIYSERDKLTLGKSQVDMIHYCYGFGYAGSVIVHFGASALAILMLKCTAKEAALWAFFTVAWGCIPQAWICLMIAMNRERREVLAVQLWKQDGCIRNHQIHVVHEMAGYLNETDVRYNPRYRNALGTVIKSWLLEHYDETGKSRGITEVNIKTASVIFREIVEKIPEQERATFEEEILKTVCDQLNADGDLEEERQNVAALLLSCGYIRFLYAQAKEKLGKQINRTVYFHQQENKVYHNCLNWIQDMLCALEWVLFLKQQAEVPRNATGKSLKEDYIEHVFVQLILSVWEGNDLDIEKIARVSWQQL